ncbi:putative permease, major facilitator superfamily [Methylorubrum extorquens DM4]|uniref:Permease, major facilitator superfamily n=1 Tax=Methylorubrum extorquens (strain DSM 6343 / CIP 106787 / DM4) TaxID=661410 RepID=C7CAU2_METED|nr:OFA family MFS transporter [Methylorubrum extorquens]CAX24225.1 putative permease, major facilitator superfamily [Methylorubrum extorquens DM4]
MSALERAEITPNHRARFLDRERTIAGVDFNRWLVPPAALAIHLCIGMAYGFSVFWLPMSRLLPNTDASTCTNLGFTAELFATSCNWSVPAVTHIFEVFIAVLGISAAVWGGWLERAGPRKAGVISALCWGGGLVLAGLAVSVHQLWLVYLISIICGIGQGLGYITPVSTLIKWFPDRRGMATGFAIMGYGGGAMIGAPLAVWLMGYYSSNGIPGVSWGLISMGIIYFVVMCAGALGFRVAPSGWRPVGWAPPASQANAMITQRHVHLRTAWRTPQFWLIWGVLFLNVTAGIAVISMASPMLQDVFGARLLGVDSIASLTAAQRGAIAAAAAGLVGLISLFNSVGRIFWASLSDKFGRKNTYYAFFVLGIILYCLLPTWGHIGVPALFVASICIILSMYGGGFATVPAYLADIFGTQMVGAIHGALITAWSAAGVVGPAVIAGLRQVQLDHGVPPNLVYDRTLYIMAFLLFCGVICNFFIRPVAQKHWMTDEELATERALQHEDRASVNAETAARGPFGVGGVLAWLAVGIPFFIGLFIALQKAVALM